MVYISWKPEIKTEAVLAIQHKPDTDLTMQIPNSDCMELIEGLIMNELNLITSNTASIVVNIYITTPDNAIAIFIFAMKEGRICIFGALD